MNATGFRTTKRSAENGTVLVLTAATVVIVAVLTASLALTTAVNLRIAENSVAGLANRQAALSALEIAKTLKREQPVLKEGKTETSVFSYTLGNTRLKIQFVDEESKINVNRLIARTGRVDTLTREQLERLFYLYIDDWEGTVERLVDYIDGDTKGTYETRAKNAPFDTIEELLLIEGITSEMFFGDAKDGRPGLRNCLTIESSGSINLNTASAQVLLSLSGELSRDDVKEIIQSRKENPFTRPHDLVERGIIDQHKFNSLGRRLVTKGANFHMYITTTTGNATKTYEALLKERGKSTKVSYIRELRK